MDKNALEALVRQVLLEKLGGGAHGVRAVRVPDLPVSEEHRMDTGDPRHRVYTRDQLLDEVWGFDYFGDSRTVDVHIKRLREKVENVSDQWELKTVWGVGYKFEVKK